MEREKLHKILTHRAVLRAEEVAEILEISVRTVYRRAAIEDPLIRLVSRRPCRIAVEPLRKQLLECD